MIARPRHQPAPTTQRSKPVPPVPPAPPCPPHLRLRVLAVRRRLDGWGAGGLLITNPRDIRYLTGFLGEDSWALVTAKPPHVTIITDFRFQEEVGRQAPHAAVRIRRGPLTQALATLLDRRHIDKVALQAHHVTLALRTALVKKLGARRLLVVDDGMVRQRAVKDDQEVRAIRRALRIQQEAYQRTLAQIMPGQSEQETAAYLEYQMRQLGADGPSFPTIVAADANASLPHAVPGSRRFKKGGSVLIDWGARWRGYCSDLTRVVAIGSMSRRMREVYSVVLEAQQTAIGVIKPGTALKQVDAAARRVIERAGYGDRFGHSLGHGLGLDIHEQPTLAGSSDGPLQPGHVVTVEPGVYLPGMGGVRIEDDVLVTEHGCRVLSDLPRGLESAII